MLLFQQIEIYIKISFDQFNLHITVQLMYLYNHLQCVSIFQLSSILQTLIYFTSPYNLQPIYIRVTMANI